MANRLATRSGLGGVVIAVLLAGCSASLADPAFESDDVVAAAVCTDERLCVEVRAPVVGDREGAGSCALYGAGDPDDLEPLAESGELRMTPGVTIVWAIEVAPDLEIADLNPVCEPMIEG